MKQISRGSASRLGLWAALLCLGGAPAACLSEDNGPPGRPGSPTYEPMGGTGGRTNSGGSGGRTNSGGTGGTVTPTGGTGGSGTGGSGGGSGTDAGGSTSKDGSSATGGTGGSAPDAGATPGPDGGSVSAGDAGAIPPTPDFPPKGQCLPGIALRGVLPTPPADVPAAKLDLALWKITLPIADDLTCATGSTTQFRTGAKEVKQPLLNKFKDERFFFLGPDGGAVFRATAAGSATTENSKYPRSELRERTPYDPILGATDASWATNDGKTHTLIVTQAVTQLPNNPNKVVTAQIHDAKDDLIMVALTNQNLAVEWMDGKLFGTLDTAYKLGTKFTVKIEAANGVIRVYYNDMNTPKIEKNVSATGCYFKAGVYSQSLGSGTGEVKIYDLQISHK